MEEFWECVVMLQEARQLLHLCLQNDVFRHTSYTVCSAVLAVLLFSPSNPRGWYLWGSYGPMWFRRIFSPVSFQKSWEGQWFMAPISRDPQHCLEHLVTSDWQVFPPPTVIPSSWVWTELYNACGVVCMFSDATGLTLMLPLVSVSLAPLGDAYQKGIGDHFHICIKWSPSMKHPSLLSAHTYPVILEGLLQVQPPSASPNYSSPPFSSL